MVINCKSEGWAGGVFGTSTSLSAGAVLGDALAHLSGVSVSNHNPLVLVSFLTGVVRSPFTAAVLVLEMTVRHSAFFQLLLSGLLVQGVGTLVG
ncbi:chloride channel protein [Hymenobacter sp. 15J16-1T3B]|uniref:chloride channel protein n=1 Tax=Hymenobacter sp. 15J16-1T3B TaxID=2886941 RepID=UPI001D11C3C6|nr:chloride channel protein [Hymenobacter sp. 15J16-1T3B]MCC3159811.1 chloride channel protein [Hymenobacter sp. 15J16-1T3B]